MNKKYKRKPKTLRNELKHAHKKGKNARNESFLAGKKHRHAINREMKSYKYMDVWF